MSHGSLGGPGALALLQEARNVLHDGRKSRNRTAVVIAELTVQELVQSFLKTIWIFSKNK